MGNPLPHEIVDFKTTDASIAPHNMWHITRCVLNLQPEFLYFYKGKVI